MRYKKIYLLFIIFGLISISLWGTFAYFKWTTSTEQRTNIVLTVESTFMCEADGGGNITEEDINLVPTDCTNPDYAVKREVKVKPSIFGDTQILMNLWLDVNDLGSGLSNSNNFKYALTTEENSCTSGVVKSGNFRNKRIGDKISLFNNVGYITSTEETYYLYIWLDKAETSTTTMDQSFDLSLNGMCTDAPESKTFIVFNQEDTTLRFFKRDNGVSGVSNNMENLDVGRLDNNVQTIEDLNISEDDKVYFDLENTVYTSEEQLPWYSYRDSITKVIIEDELFPITTAYWFKDLKNVTYIDLSKLDTSKVTDMTNMFSGMSKLTSLDLSNFNTSKVTNMYHMFDGMSSLTSLDLSAFDTSKVTNMSSMFNGCSKIKNLDLGNFNTNNVLVMRAMFIGMSSLTSLNVSSFRTTKITDLGNMFSGCSSLATLDLSNFDTSNVTKMNRTFADMSSLTSLNVSNFNTSKVVNVTEMFSNCSSLTTLDVSNFDTSNVTDINRMFSNMSSLISLNLSNFDTSNVTNMDKLFRGCTKLTNLNLSNADFSKVITYIDMFLNVPNNSNIVVKDSAQKSWINEKFSNLTNVVVKS